MEEDFDVKVVCETQPPPGSPSNREHTPEALVFSEVTRTTWLQKLLLLALLFSASISVIAALFMTFPRMKTLVERRNRLHSSSFVGEDDVVLVLKIPKNLEELKAVRSTLELYQKEFKVQVALGYICVYLFLQTFMIPGSSFLNLLASSLFGFLPGLILVTVLGTIGASCLYFVSYFILKDLVYHKMPERCEKLSREVQRRRRGLLYYLLFLRITPVVPAWFVNVASPIVSIPFRDFFLATLIGFIPANVVTVKAGGVLSHLKSLRDLYDVPTLLTLFLLSGLSLLPVCLRGSLDDSHSRPPLTPKTR